MACFPNTKCWFWKQFTLEKKYGNNEFEITSVIFMHTRFYNALSLWVPKLTDYVQNSLYDQVPSDTSIKSKSICDEPFFSTIQKYLDMTKLFRSWSKSIFTIFRIFRGPLFHKPVTGQELFFAVSYSKPALAPSELPANLPGQFCLSGQLFLHWAGSNKSDQ